MAKILGIDLGTTNSAMAVMEGGEPVIIPNAEGNRTTPSVVAVNPKTGERMVGQVAKRQAVTNPKNTIFSVKRFMGRKYKDPEVQRALQYVPYEVREAPNGDVRVVMGGKDYSPPEISAMILQKLKDDAEAYLGEKITQAVITVPAYFNDSQRQATKDAGKIAGLEVLRIINEPTASSLAYGLDKKGDEHIAVYDLGGGTFDISILDVGDGVFEVKSTNGDTFLGGDDFDQRVINYVAEEFKRSEGIDLRQDTQALQRLKEAAEKAKIELSTTQQTEINLPFITADASGPKHLQTSISRAKFEQLSDHLFKRLIGPTQLALKEAKLEPSRIDEVLLVGGSTRIPKVQQIVKDLFNGKEPNRSLNPDEVVALGAAVQAGIATGEVKDILVLDATPLSLGIEVQHGEMNVLIPKNTTIPTKKTQIYSTATDNQTAVTVQVYQGERPIASQNRLLGRFDLTGIPPAPRGMPQIEVTFDIDANGILKVYAKDKATNKEAKIEIKSDSGLSQAEIERMKQEAQANEADDQKRLEVIRVKNDADKMIYSVETMLRDMGDKVSSSERADIEAKKRDLEEAVKTDDVTRIKSMTEALTKASHGVAERLYKSGAQPQGSSTGPGGAEGNFGRGQTPPGPEGKDEGGGKDRVVDADFSVKN